MKLPNSSQLKRLCRLSKVREKLALFELNEASTGVRTIQLRLRELTSRPKEFDVGDDPRVMEKWGMWRDQEVRKTQMKLALAKATHLETTKRCGKAIAEAKLIRKLVDFAAQEQSDLLAKVSAEELAQLHLLANNVGD